MNQRATYGQRFERERYDAVGRHVLGLELVDQYLVDLPGVSLPFRLLHDLADEEAYQLVLASPVLRDLA